MWTDLRPQKSKRATTTTDGFAAPPNNTHRGWWGGRNGLKMAHGGMNATRVEVRALQLDLAREEEQLREATRLTDKRKV